MNGSEIQIFPSLFEEEKTGMIETDQEGDA